MKHKGKLVGRRQSDINHSDLQFPAQSTDLPFPREVFKYILAQNYLGLGLGRVSV